MIEYLDIVVIFTDNTSNVFKIEPKTTVKLFREIVAQSIDLKDEIYFGFCIKDDCDRTYWLCDNKSVISHEYFKGVFSNIKLHFVIKYFYEINNVLSDEVIKYYLYNQLKYGIYSGDIECDSDQCFQFLAMTLCIDGLRFENFCEQTKKMSIIPLHLFSKHPSVEHCIWKIEEKYTELIIRNENHLMETFISMIFQLPTEITHFFLSKDFNSSNVIIGINKNGFIECNTNSKSSYKLTYKWSEITNITSNKFRLNLDIQDCYQKNRSSFRRKSCASSVSYEVANSHLAKSIVYLAKDTIDFISTYRDSPVSTLKFSQCKSEKRNMSYIKKFNNSSTASRKGEKSRMPIGSIFMSENSVEMSRSPSRMSITSSTYNESFLTNDSGSLQYDDDSLNSTLSLQELKQKYTELYTKKVELQKILNQKLNEAIELSKEEFTMTCKIPSDHKLLDPMGEVYFTKNPLPSCLLNPENQSDYQNEKNRLLLQIETISNIYNVLRKTPKADKKFRRELEDKKKEITIIKEKLNSLEMEHATQIGSLTNCRSNSVGNLNRISSRLSTNYSVNGKISNDEKNQFENKLSYATPLTEPSQRRFKPPEKANVELENLNDDMDSRVRKESENDLSPSPHYRVTTSNQTTDGYPLYSNNNCINSTNFQRFHSARNIIKNPPSIQIVKYNSPVSEKLNLSSDPNNSSVSSESRSSIDDVLISDISNSNDYTKPRKQSDNSINKMVSLRHHSISNVQNCRDSMEINHDRLDYMDSRYNRRILSKSNKVKRQSTSLEDLREEESSTNIKYLARRDQKVSTEPFYSMNKTRVTYRPSIKDGNLCNLTKGKQPSIVLKQAKNNSIND